MHVLPIMWFSYVVEINCQRVLLFPVTLSGKLARLVAWGFALGLCGPQRVVKIAGKLFVSSFAHDLVEAFGNASGGGDCVKKHFADLLYLGHFVPLCCCCDVVIIRIVFTNVNTFLIYFERIPVEMLTDETRSR